jgi:lysozyme
MTPTLRTNALELAKLAERFKSEVYLCPAGKRTIGYGHNLDASPLTIKLTRPIEEGITEPQAAEQLEHDLTAAWDDLVRHLPWVRRLDEVRQAVLLDMTFNMGWPTFSQFKATQRFTKDGLYQHAAHQMVRSRWYRQVGHRGRRLVRMMASGEWPTFLRAA